MLYIVPVQRGLRTWLGDIASNTYLSPRIPKWKYREEQNERHWFHTSPEKVCVDVTAKEYNPGKVQFTGDSSIRFAEELRAMDASDLYFSTLEYGPISIFDRIVEATNESGRYCKSRGIKSYQFWPDGGLNKNDLKEMIRIRIGMDLVKAR